MNQRWRPSPGYLTVALLLAVGVAVVLVFLWLTSGPDTGTDAPAPVQPPAGSATGPAPAAQPSMASRGSPAAPQHAPEGDADPTPDLRSYVARGEKPSMAEVITRLHERGIHTGLAAFNPPGTRPPLVGLAVPEDFPLPPGYVRHHQATDDGQRIEAILMYAPGYQPVDAAGRPIAVPKDRVVPPEQAPPGLAVRRITIPPPLDPTQH
ncbi:hypothetical protein GCM10027277_01520 [Pseudoduganella ginsengisoli]|uniref:Uncharacterized protein n=1 Tax=Pseudoduganella ginsengisoli TaxID=1462440 RepID=A0A6L6QA33_9BURK|nr:hypothetical protein [Pseudoduganella ginsengisoli]MTW06102.1 hypothetical protein [Pseudoduganella ginsengisoli]